MRAYIAFEAGDPHEGAALVFAENLREAKRKAWRNIGWLDCDYVDLRVRLADWGQDEYLRRLHAEYGKDVIDDPPTCPVCETWGAPMRPDGTGCENCGGDDL